MSINSNQSSTSSVKVSRILKVLAQICEKREGMANVPADAIHEESDIENDLALPQFDCFYSNRGLQTLVEMSNFNFNEFDCL